MKNVFLFLFLWMGTLSLWAGDKNAGLNDSDRMIPVKNEKVFVEPTVMQAINVTGKVVDAEGLPLPGVTVLIKGTTQGTATDINGAYSLQIPNVNTTLVFTFIGFVAQETAVGNRQVVNITLLESTSELDEVVVIGYGTMRKRDVTGAISQMKATTVSNEAPRDVRDMLRANVAGLNIGYSVDAKPGGSLEVRGRNTLTASSSPLLVVDGVIYYGGLEDINPADIESIDVLKDASSAAVYGAKAASGVVVVMTRKGSHGKPRIDASATVGFVTMGVDQPVHNGASYLQWRSDLQKQRNRTIVANNPGRYDDPRHLPPGVSQEQWLAYDTNDGDLVRTWLRRIELQPNEIDNYLNGKETDWYNAVFREGKQQDYNLSLSGKKEEVTYYWSFGYTDNESLIYGEDYSTIRSRINLDADVTKFLTVGVSTQFAYRDESHLFWDSDGRNQQIRANWGAMRDASPWGDMYNEDGSYRRMPAGQDPMTTNPFYEMSYLSRDRTYITLNSSMYSKVKLPFNITFQSTFVPRFQIHNYMNHQSSKHVDWNGIGGSVRRENSKVYQWQLDNLLKWNQTFGIHSFDVTLLQNSEKYSSWETIITSQQFSPNDILGYHFLSGATSHLASSNDAVSTGAAYMARIFYSLMDRYMITATVRRDGYSAFGQRHPWADFASAALAWRFTDENFWNDNLSTVLEHGKLRVSYGTNGNRDIGMYEALSDLNVASKYFYAYANTGALYQRSQMWVSRMSNKDLKWEKTASLNVGLDFTFRKQIIDGSFEVYQASTKDLLMKRSLPDIVGFDNVMANLGEVQNRGIELTINSNNIRKEKLTWRTSFAFSRNVNKIVHLYGDMVDVVDAGGNVIGQKEGDDYTNSWFIGHPINTIWQLNPKGVWQIGEETEAAKYGAIPGDFKITKRVEPAAGGSYALTNDDKEFIGQTVPKFRWTLRNDFTFLRDFNFSFMMYSCWGQKKEYNYPKHNRTSAERLSDYKLPYWTPENPINDYGRLYSRDPAAFSIFWDNSFIRLDNVSLAYNVPAKITNKFATQSLKLFFTIRNVAVWTKKWDFWDPENNGPTPRTYTFGLNLTL